MKVPSSKALSETLGDFKKVQGKALLAGGIAVIHYGYERSTSDIDALYAHIDGGILKRLDADFKVVLRAENGWHHLQHRKTGVRLELIPEGGLTTYGFIPGPKLAGGKNGIVSLSGLIWMKLVSGRSKDDADVIEVAKVRMAKVEACRAKIPAELHERFDALIARAKRELAFDPSRNPNQCSPDDRVEESPAPYARKAKPKRRKSKKKAAKKKARTEKRKPRAKKSGSKSKVKRGKGLR